MQNETNINTNGHHPELQNLAAPEPGEGGSETPKLPNPYATCIPSLQLFTVPAMLEQIGSTRVDRFLARFANELNAAGISIPQPGSENGHYFSSVAALFSRASLPERLRSDLSTLEEAASPHNQGRLDATIAERISHVNPEGRSPLDCALELWFAAPDSLAQFVPPAFGVPASAGSESSPLQNLAAPEPGEGGSQTPELPNPHPAAPDSLSQFVSASSSSSASASASFSLAAQDPSEGGALGVPASAGSESSPLQNLTAPEPGEGGSRTPKLQNFPSTLQHSTSVLDLPEVVPWPEPVDGKLLLNSLLAVLRRFVVLPKWAAETLALWIVHTFAFQLRDVSTYIGLESPEKQCGKTTLLTVLSELANRALTASNISPPAFFRVIEDLCPTLLIDEADTFLRGNEQLRGILNAGYKRKTAFVLRASFAPAADDASQSASASCSASDSRSHALHAPRSDVPSVSRFSCWCPKLISQIGRLPETLADRCIVIRIQRKTHNEECERLRYLEATTLQRQCARFVLDHRSEIASARPQLPSSLSDRAADIWEPLLALAELAGGEWPELARQAAVSLSASAQQNNPIGSLLLDIFVIFLTLKADRLFTRDLLVGLNQRLDRPWAEARQGKEINEMWLSHRLRPYCILPKTMRIGELRAKGYLLADFSDAFKRYIPRSEVEALKADLQESTEKTSANETPTDTSGSSPDPKGSAESATHQ